MPLIRLARGSLLLTHRSVPADNCQRRRQEVAPLAMWSKQFKEVAHRHARVLPPKHQFGDAEGDIMPTNIRIIHAHDFIQAAPDGQLDLEMAKRLLLEVASASAPLAEYEVIIDTRSAKSRMSATDLWYLAAELGGLRKSFSGKTAVLCPVKRFDSAAFFALCSQNRGLEVKAFTSFEGAVGWLISDER